MNLPQSQLPVTPAPTPSGVTVVAADKLPFTPPKLTFVTPKLTKQGRVEALTASLLGSFSP